MEHEPSAERRHAREKLVADEMLDGLAGHAGLEEDLDRPPLVTDDRPAPAREAERVVVAVLRA
jgi:hypothetical protein